MKRNNRIKLCMAICFLFGMLLFPDNQLKAQAAEVIATVQGTVSSETTSDLLYLSTSAGKMEIKLDSGTDASACKILLPDKKISVSVSHGSDGYLHAVKITSEAEKNEVSIDTSATATVTGTIDKKSKGDVLRVNTAQGSMDIKFDTSTNLSGCTVLVAGKTYNITCARGSDAYMHAISISDGSGAAAADSSSSGSTVNTSLTPAPADPSNVKTPTLAVTGKVTGNTKENLLYLSTKDGEMQIVIENNTDTRSGMVMTPDRQITASLYYGSDSYWHAVSVLGVKGVPASVNVNTSATATVSGTVGSKSTEDMLYLETDQGTMELKLDVLQGVSGCKVLVKGKKLKVTCAYGSDSYMHAIQITTG